MINERLTHTVSIVKVSMVRGVRTEAASVSEDAFIEEGSRVLRDDLGSHLQSYTRVFLNSDADVDIGDDIIVGSVTRPVINISSVRDPDGLHHLEVELG